MQPTSANHVVNSAVATVVAEVMTLPICTIKTNYQNSKTDLKSVVRSIYQRGGLAAFYKASLPAIGSQVFSTSSKYVGYRWLDKNFNFYAPVNGLISGLVTSLVTHPIDSVKIYWQMGDKFLPDLRQHGLRLFYRGYSKTFSKMAISSPLFFPMFDYFNNYFKNPLLASLSTATIATIIMHPVDYLKTRHIYGLPLYESMNPLSYYRGVTLNLARIVPHFTIMMTIIKTLESHKISV